MRTHVSIAIALASRVIYTVINFSFVYRAKDKNYKTIELLVPAINFLSLIESLVI